jgi:transposase
VQPIPLEFSIPLDKPSILQVISDTAQKLRNQGLSFRKIAKVLLVDEKTVRNALKRGKKLLSLLLT